MAKRDKKKDSDSGDDVHFEFMDDTGNFNLESPPDDVAMLDHIELNKPASEDKPIVETEPAAKVTETDKRDKVPKTSLTQHKHVDTEKYEFPPEKSAKSYMPWEIDLQGRPLSEKKKHPDPTPYEKWLNKKRKTEAEEVICPRCGALNYDLAFVSGEKCKKCGFDIDKGENIEFKMNTSDRKAGRSVRRRLINDASVPNIAGLEIPGELMKFPDSEFSYEFTSGSWAIYMVFVIASLIGIVYFGARANPANEDSGMYTVILLVDAAIFIYALIGLSRTMAVTSIKTDQDGVTFSGWGSQQFIDYEDIESVLNDRRANGRSNFVGGVGTGSTMSPFLWWFLFGWRGLILSYFFDDDRDTDMALDNSSTSPYFTNYITIKAKNTSFEYSFCGSGNVPYIRALAIIVFMATRKNKNCFISHPALLAAERTDRPYLF